MTDKTRLPVFALTGEALTFCARKFPQIILLNILTLIILAGPVVLLIALFYQEYFNALLAQTEALTVPQKQEVAIRMLPIQIFMSGAAILTVPVVNTTVIRAITRGENLIIPQLGKDVLRYLFTTSMVAALAFALVALTASFGSLSYVATSHLPTLSREAMVLAGAVLAAGLIYGIIRLMLIPADVVTNSKLGLTRGFELTKGQFWPLFMAFILCLFSLILILFLAGLIAGVLQPAEGMVIKSMTWPIPGTNEFFYFNVPDYEKSLQSMAVWLISSLTQYYAAAVFVALPAIAYAHLNGIRTISEQEEVLEEYELAS